MSLPGALIRPAASLGAEGSAQGAAGAVPLTAQRRVPESCDTAIKQVGAIIAVSRKVHIIYLAT